MHAGIPIHTHSHLSDNGVFARIVSTDDTMHNPADYAHRDDYYMFGMIVSGSLCCNIDFREHHLSEGDIQFIRPGQVHRFVSSDGFCGWMLMAEASLVDDGYRRIFEESAVRGVSALPTVDHTDDLMTLFTVIHNMTGQMAADNIVVRHLVSAFIGMFAGRFQKACEDNADCGRRRLDIVVNLNEMLDSSLHVSHSPSYYADRLCFSAGYLNEIVKDATGWSVGRYIRNEIVLRAKRLLVHTNLTVAEIASSLGFEDNAYFTRLFAKISGMTPTAFRQKH